MGASAKLWILPQDSPVYYIHFLRGVARERLGRTEEARASYDLYREYSRSFPAPARFRISGSSRAPAPAPGPFVASTTQPHSVEDVDHSTTGTVYYRWRVTGVTGTGFFTLCTRRP